MKSNVIRDRKVRSKVKQYELRRRALKYGQREQLFPREDVRKRLAELPRDSSPTRVKRYCLYTKRSRGVLRGFNRSRRYFREQVKRNRIPGITPSTW